MHFFSVLSALTCLSVFSSLSHVSLCPYFTRLLLSLSSFTRLLLYSPPFTCSLLSLSLSHSLTSLFVLLHSLTSLFSFLHSLTSPSVFISLAFFSLCPPSLAHFSFLLPSLAHFSLCPCLTRLLLLSLSSFTRSLLFSPSFTRSLLSMSLSHSLTSSLFVLLHLLTSLYVLISLPYFSSLCPPSLSQLSRPSFTRSLLSLSFYVLPSHNSLSVSSSLTSHPVSFAHSLSLSVLFGLFSCLFSHLSVSSFLVPLLLFIFLAVGKIFVWLIVSQCLISLCQATC